MELVPSVVTMTAHNKKDICNMPLGEKFRDKIVFRAMIIKVHILTT
jgi:hypothetical protein